MHSLLRIMIAAFALFVLGCASTPAPEEPVFSRIVLPGNLLLFSSPEGGNVLAIASKTGVLLVDSGEPKTASRLHAELASLNRGSVRAIIVTHYHWDHSGGVNILGGGQTRIYSTSATGDAWVHPGNERPKAADGLEPTDIVQGTLSLTWGSETLEVEPIPPAHTTGDLIVWVRSQNSVFLGDLFQFDGYPSVGLPDGGTHRGTIHALRDIIARTDEATLMIPGHGYPASRTDLIAWTEMLDKVTTRVEDEIGSGHTLEEVIATHPTAEFDARWGRGYLKPDDFVRKLYRDLTGYYKAVGKAGE